MTRIVPARPTSRRGRIAAGRGATSPRSPPSDSRPLVGSPSASTPPIARPWAWTRMPMPGPDLADDARRRALDGFGVLADGHAPVAAVPEDELARVGSGGAAAGVRPAPADQRSPGRASSPAGAAADSSQQPRVAERARRSWCRRTIASPGGDEGAVAGREPEADLDRLGDHRAARHEVEPAAMGPPLGDVRRRREPRSSSVARQPQRFLPRVEQLAAVLEAVRQPERHVAKVDAAGRRARRRRRPRTSGRGRRGGRRRGSGTRRSRPRRAAGRRARGRRGRDRCPSRPLRHGP